MTRERKEELLKKIRDNITEAQLKLDMEKRNGRANGMKAMKYEREIAYWSRLLEKLNNAQIVE